jgi:site-specific DNA-methyltransferase (adenine-specific)
MSDWQILRGDCVAEMRGLPDACVDSVVTDPPYELNFMGKKWDASGISYSIDLWREVLRVLKPGGHLLAFGATRTYHRMACAIEDAGFEVRDSLHWIYGSGFPKSLDVSKAIDKMAGAQRLVVGTSNKGVGNVRGEHAESGFAASRDKVFELTAPATAAAAAWEGWGTALKPAHEPIVLARKPLVGTVADNVLQHGTGALNVDGCRIGWESDADRESAAAAAAAAMRAGADQNANRTAYGKFNDGAASIAPYLESMQGGRWPANVLLSEEAAAELDAQSGLSPAKKARVAQKGGCNGALGRFAGSSADAVGHWPEDAGGGASRFFYVAKPSRSEREAGCGANLPARSQQQQQREDGHIAGLISKSGAEACGRKDGSAGLNNPRAGAGRTAENIRNFHPTVKPITLMRYLVRLVTPPSGVVLDPFCGSGTTGCGAALEGFDFLGIEREPDYARIAEARIAHWSGRKEAA